MKGYRECKRRIEIKYLAEIDSAIEKRIHRLAGLDDIREMCNEMRREEKYENRNLIDPPIIDKEIVE
jgi:hypothetical protein